MIMPRGETLYRVVTESGKDYAFIQPSVNKNTENHTLSKAEIAFVQKAESFDSTGASVLNITVTELKYLASGPKGTTMDFDSSREKTNRTLLLDSLVKAIKLKLPLPAKLR